MIAFTEDGPILKGRSGNVPIKKDDEVTLKLAMIFEGLRGDSTIEEICAKFGYSRQWYYAILKAFRQGGSEALRKEKTGPRTNYRRGAEAERQIIRYRCLDPKMSAPVIAQRLKQDGIGISLRSVQRVIADYGLQKKTPLS